MNEQIKELAVQAGLDAKEIRDDESLTLYAFEEFDIEKFAELVRQDALEEAAKICDQLNYNGLNSLHCAAAIRNRSEEVL